MSLSCLKLSPKVDFWQKLNIMKLNLILCCMIISMVAFGQNGSISGIVKDETNESLVSATVKLLNSSDSVFIKGEITDVDGRYILKNVSPGTYFLQISTLSYTTYFSSSITLTSSRFDIILPPIKLIRSQQELKEVVIESKNPIIEQDIDKTIVHVDAMIGSATSNTYDILEKTPGLLVEANGSITLNGKGIAILIDGRPTFLAGIDLANYLKSLPGNLIDKIELIENPSSKYDAGGGGLVNIKLKKRRNLGLTGHLSSAYNMGQLFRHNQNIYLNQNTGKRNFYAIGSWGRDANLNTETIQRNFLSNNSNAIIYSDHTYHTNSMTGQAGFDWTFSKKTSLGLMAHLQHQASNSNNEFNTGYTNTNNTIDQYKGLMKGTGLFDRQNLNANLVHKIDDSGKELIADLNFINHKSGAYQSFDNTYIQNEKDLFSYQSPSHFKIVYGKIDYVLPFKNKTLFETGIKSSFVRNDLLTEHIDINQKINYLKSNHYLFDENIHSVYLNFRAQKKRLGAQLGLRYENTVLEGNLLANEAYADQRFNQKYNFLGYSIFINTKLDSLGQQSFSFNVSNRINRPNYFQFNPFRNYEDNLNYREGNPSLKPSYTTSVNLSYNNQNGWAINLGIQYVTNLIGENIKTVNGVNITRYENAGHGYPLFMVINKTQKLNTWWSIQATISGARLHFTDLNSLKTIVYTYRGGVVQQFKFKNGLSAELHSRYQGLDLNPPNNKRKPRFRIEAAIQKNILNDKGNIKISLDDLAYSWIENAVFYGLENMEQTRLRKTDSRRAGIAFSYRFGNDKYAYKSRRSGQDEEKNRMENGSGN